MPEAHTHDAIFPERVIAPEYGDDHLPTMPEPATDLDAIRMIAIRASLVMANTNDYAVGIHLDLPHSAIQVHRCKLNESLQRLADAVEQAQKRGVI